MVKLADGKERRILYVSATSYWSADWRPISAAKFLKRLFGDLSSMVADEDELRAIWSDPENREAFLTKLEENGYDQDVLEDIRRLVDGVESDLFDVLTYVLYANYPKTRGDRAMCARELGLPETNVEIKELLFSILKAH